MIGGIIFLVFFIAMLGFFLHGVYSYYKFRKAERKDWEDFIESLTPESAWILQKVPNTNPFCGHNSDVVVTIVETRKNFYGDIWVQYRFRNTGDLYERQASDFKKLYSKLN